MSVPRIISDEQARLLERCATALAKDSKLTIKQVAWDYGWRNELKAFRAAYKAYFKVYPTEHRRWLSDQYQEQGDLHIPKAITCWVETTTHRSIQVGRVGSVGRDDVIDVVGSREVYVYYEGQRLALERIGLSADTYRRIFRGQEHIVRVETQPQGESIHVRYQIDGSKMIGARVRVKLFVGMNLKLKRNTHAQKGLVTHLGRENIFYLPEKGNMTLFEVEDVLPGGSRIISCVDGLWKARLDFRGEVVQVYRDDGLLDINRIREVVTKVPHLRTIWRDYLNDPDYRPSRGE